MAVGPPPNMGQSMAQSMIGQASAPAAGQGGQQTVRVRVQVVDMKSFTLDLELPTYLPARDLTQRVARDAGLNAFWTDGRRRLYWLRARGRLLQDEETLGDLGVIDQELVYLLPEPPQGSGVLEQVPDYPENRGYTGKGTLTLLGSVAGVMAWATGWGTALIIDRNLLTVIVPGLGMGFLCISLSRHMWGGQGSQARVALTAVIFYLLVFVLVFLPAVFFGEELGAVYAQSVSGFTMGLIGVFVGWLAWWGAVESLPPLPTQAEVAEEKKDVEIVPCGICAQGVVPDVRAACPYGCGQNFHKGCYQARLSVYRGDPRFCAVCNARVR
jgi:hypothetical protein